MDTVNIIKRTPSEVKKRAELWGITNLQLAAKMKRDIAPQIGFMLNWGNRNPIEDIDGAIDAILEDRAEKEQS